MSQHDPNKRAMDAGGWEGEIQRRLRWGKAKLLISHIFCFILVMIVIFFVI